MKTGTLNRFEWLKAVNRSDLLPRAKVTAAALAIEFCNDETGQLNPGIERLAESTGQSPASVNRAIHDLKEGGWLATVEGGWRSKNAQYTLLTPGKVIAFSSAKSAAHSPQRKGGSGSFSGRETAVSSARKKPVTRDTQKSISASESLSPVCGKPITGDASYNIAKQTMNKGERSPWHRFRDYQFAGNRDQGPRYLTKEDDWHNLNGWSEWLANRGLPPLCQLPISEETKKKTVFFLPYRDAPTDPARCNEAYDYFTNLMDAGALAYAAQ